MVSAADRLSMESESSSEAPVSLIVGAHRARFLLMIGDAFRGAKEMLACDVFWFPFPQCRVDVSLLRPPAFFAWLALFDAFTNTHSI